MGFFSKLFGKKEQREVANCYPPTRGNIKKVFAQPSESCYHQWREIRGGEWDEHRYGKHFEIASEGSWYAYFRDVYHCPLCGGEVLTETFALY